MDLVEQLLVLFTGKHGPCGSGTSPMFIVAHPDDEVIGAGGHLPRWPSARVIYLTNGAPEDSRDAVLNGLSTAAEYAALRRAESGRALTLAGIPHSNAIYLGFQDQRTSLALANLVSAIRDILEKLRPGILVTHAYEGGHPDHDSTAFAVRMASQMLKHSCGYSPVLLEMTSYFNRAGIMVTGEFLPRADCPPLCVKLTPDQRASKASLFECYGSQKHVLRYFTLEQEQFRLAPFYDFSLPPHRGSLYYEMFPWGMTGTQWRELARTAIPLDACIRGPGRLAYISPS